MSDVCFQNTEDVVWEDTEDVVWDRCPVPVVLGPGKVGPPALGGGWGRRRERPRPELQELTYSGKVYLDFVWEAFSEVAFESVRVDAAPEITIQLPTIFRYKAGVFLEPNGVEASVSTTRRYTSSVFLDFFEAEGSIKRSRTFSYRGEGDIERRVQLQREDEAFLLGSLEEDLW